ncbi:hypothetical protein MKX01_007460 [Papaver californicum]|nr:hypothetical protein MKX01_007460 [Papaver californicum]
MRRIIKKSGLGDETYAPPFIFKSNVESTLDYAVQEAEEGMFSSVDSIDVLIVTSGTFTSVPSLPSILVHRYNLHPDIKTFNLSGMGCSSGVMCVDLAANVLRGCQNLIRTHHGADDSAYKAAFQKEDELGNLGISLTKDLIRVAARVLPMSQFVLYAYSVIQSVLSLGELKSVVPDFTTAFDHICIHTGGKAVIEQVSRVLKLGEEVTEPERMRLHRFGNTSSSLVFYELAYFEAKWRVKRDDEMWMLAFGTGFKVCSIVFKSLRDSPNNHDESKWIIHGEIVSIDIQQKHGD